MKLIYFISILLISNTFCSIYIGRNKKETISSVSSTNYIYIKLDEFKGYDTFYVLIEVKYSGTIYEKLGISYCNDVSNPGNYYNHYSYGSTESTNSVGYYYKFDYKNYKYLVIANELKYYYTSTRLVITTYDSNPLSFILIIVVIVVCIIGGFILIPIIVFLFILFRRRKNRTLAGGTINPIQPTPIIPANQQNNPVYNPQIYVYTNQPLYPQAPAQVNLYQPPQ